MYLYVLNDNKINNQLIIKFYFINNNFFSDYLFN